MYHYNKEILRKGVPKLYTRWGKENIIEVIYSNVGAAADIFFKGGDAPKKTLIVFFFLWNQTKNQQSTKNSYLKVQTGTRILKQIPGYFVHIPNL